MAKKQQPEQSPPPAPDVPEAKELPKSYRLYITLGFVSLILFQMIMVFLLLPRSGAQTGGGGHEGYGNAQIPDAKDPITKDKMVERPIGNKKFQVQQMRKEQNEKFSLLMHVIIRQQDAKKFDPRYAECEFTILDRINGILLAASQDECSEAGYTTIKERAKNAINEVLGTPWVQQVLTTETSYEVQ